MQLAYQDDAAFAAADPSIPRQMRLGAAYNLFDGEELLEASIRSVRPAVDYVCVVVQHVSNFGQPAGPRLMRVVQALSQSGLIDDVVHYEPKRFPMAARKRLISSRATGADLGGATAGSIGTQFFNELTKREIGRQACRDAGCTHFMSMDADECYEAERLEKVKQRMLAENADGCLARMRTYFKLPGCELLPRDDTNWVPVIFRVAKWLPLRLGAPYPLLCDPTRKVENARRLIALERNELEMHHFSWVRRCPATKVANSSNRGSFPDVNAWLRAFALWTPGSGTRPPLPHPTFAAMYETVGPCEIEGAFGIDAKAAAAAAASSDMDNRASGGPDSWYRGADE